MGKTNTKARGGKESAAPAKKSASIKGFFKPVSKSTPQKNKSPNPSNASRLLSPQKPVVPEGKTEVTKPCPEIGEGWTQKVILRKSGNKASDRYYFSPDGSKFRSMAGVNRFLSAEGDGKPSKVPPKKRAASPRKDVHVEGKKVKEDLDSKKKADKNKPKKPRTSDSPKPAKKIKRNGAGEKKILRGGDDEDGDESESTDRDPAVKKSNEENNFSSSRRAAKKKINYNMDLEDSDEEEFEYSKVPSKKNRRGSEKKTKLASKKKRPKDDDDSDAFEPDDASDGDESLSADSLDDESDDDFMDESVGEAPKKRKSSGKRTSGGGKKAPAKKEPRKKKGDESFEDLVKKAADRFTPTNNPQIFPDQEFVSPVGIDATDGIVVGIIRGQVRKVGKLLQSQSLREDSERELGELPSLVKLNTACSGTDAPSIALGLVRSTLDDFARTNHKDEEGGKNVHRFDYEHNMSCEIEPFKQGYIGRNFPGVLLFPDITKLADGETVTDVYGREQTIPDSNLFVAGTSCKDFSMLKNTKRKDIEDKGQSGQTFIAAVEYLEQELPKFAIFENVQNAPWNKMAEYITGRVDLSKRNDAKDIVSKDKGKPDADNKLKFIVDEDGKYVANDVPKQVGIRVGEVVAGYVSHGKSLGNVSPLSASKSDKGKEVTLKQLAKKHGFNLEEDHLIMDKGEAQYCTHLVKLDTKQYGLPQTRNRKYLFIWRSDNPDDNLGEYIDLIMNHLKQELLHSMDAFLLPETHDRIRCFREALRSGPGLLVARERAKEPDFFDYDLSGVKDTARHYAYRQEMGIDERSRWLTKWDTNGRTDVAPGLWPELVDMWNMRRKDMIDCYAAACFRDNISRDPLHHNFVWDISQNVDMVSHRSANVGVSGCVTPGGELVLTNLGRTMMGYEKLLLQGIPFSRLLLGPETEVQLSDLAGNAMSVPVVNACMLSALCAPELRRKVPDPEDVNFGEFAIKDKCDAEGGAVVADKGDLQDRSGVAKDFMSVFSPIAESLAEEAYKCSVLCNSESSGQTSASEKFFECADSGYRISSDGVDRHQTDSLNLVELHIGKRPDATAFGLKLRKAVPSMIRLGEGWEETVPEAKGLESYSFLLQRVSRGCGHWVLTYGAWEHYGSGRQVAEIRICLGKVHALEKGYCLAAFIKCYGPAIRHEKPKRGALPDSARLFVKVINGKADSEAKWELRGQKIKTTLELVGSEPCASQRVQVGLNDDACSSIKKHKPLKRFVLTFKSRNNTMHYHSKWKTWPSTIVVSGDDSDEDLNGTYVRSKCNHVTNQSALWIRKEKDSSPARYIYIRPNVGRTALDVAVISSTPSYRDQMEICELRDWIPENCLVTKTQTTDVKFIRWKSTDLKMEVPAPSMTMEKPASFQEQIDSKCDPLTLCSLRGLSDGLMKALLAHSGDGSKSSEASHIPIDLFGKMGQPNAKLVSILVSPWLLKFASEGALPLELLKWYDLAQPDDTSFGLCEKHVPSRPKEKWVEAGKSYRRVFDKEESKQFYLALQRRPSAFQMSVNNKSRELSVQMNPFVVANQSASYLLRGRGLGDDYARSVEVSYRLSELTTMGEPETKPFHVPNSDAFGETVVEGMKLPLYKRQAKALTRMKSIEHGHVEFNEEERCEEILPGVGWCMIGRACQKSPLKGGVLGDAIGSGKTVVTIALILSGIEEARKNCNLKERRSSATLIVVPPGLVDQWKDEFKKFTGSKLTILLIKSVSSLKSYSVKDILKADVVIVHAGIIEERDKKSTKLRPYTQNLAKKADSQPIPAAPSGYSCREAPTIEGTWVRNMQSGPEIYVGNRGSQGKRDVQAWYGHCYAEAIINLRKKAFDLKERGVPLEWFVFERVVIDECHEALVTASRQESKAEDFKETARRGAREFLGVSNTNALSRPLIANKAVWGLTGTPLLETEERVTELANLMGGTYITGSAHHWRRNERESGRDIFLNQQEAATKSRDYRCAVSDSCHSYVQVACQRNRGEALAVKLERKQVFVNMSESEGTKFLESAADDDSGGSNFTLSPLTLGERATPALTVTATSKSRHSALIDTINSIQEKEPGTKIIVFANSFYGGYDSARSALTSSKHEFCHVDNDIHSVDEQNNIISWFRHKDATDEDKARPRVLLLSFEQAAGHNLQEACHNVIMYDPYYSGLDAVADASVEEQALGRVMRQGQHYDVTVTRLVVRGPKGEKCLDDAVIERNLDEDVLRAATTSNFD